jgi:hypothetical protein
MIASPETHYALEEGPMSQVLLSDGPVLQERAIPPVAGNGTQVGPAETATHYLHLSAFPCEKCNGPVIAGSLGTRHDDITQETDIRKVGAACIACGFRPEITLEPSANHRFRPVEWKWAIKNPAQLAGSSDDPLPAELSQDADTKPSERRATASD